MKPIVFYLSPEVPEQWRPYIKRGIEDWQPVFEKAGFRKAIVARDAPDAQGGPRLGPRGRALQRGALDTRAGGQNAMGPAVIDPRSGEVISSHAIFFHNVLRLAETLVFHPGRSARPAREEAASAQRPHGRAAALRRLARDRPRAGPAPQLQGALGLLGASSCAAASGPSAGAARPRSWTMRA